MVSRLIFIFGFGLATAQAGPIHTESRHIVRWPIGPGDRVSYSIETTSSNVRGSVLTALERWESVGSSYIAFVEAEDAGSANIKIKIASLNSAIAGQASMDVNDYGHIVGCSVELASGLADMEGTLTHEIGHCLGLMHSTVPGAVMSYRRESGASLNDDDRLAISRLYPEGDHDLPVGCVSVEDVKRSAPRGPGSGDPMIWAGMLGMVAWAIRRKVSAARRQLR